MPEKEQILGHITDLVANFLYYDRKEDEEMPDGFIESALENNLITIEDMVQKFETELRKALK